MLTHSKRNANRKTPSCHFPYQMAQTKLFDSILRWWDWGVWALSYIIDGRINCYSTWEDSLEISTQYKTAPTLCDPGIQLPGVNSADTLPRVQKDEWHGYPASLVRSGKQWPSRGGWLNKWPCLDVTKFCETAWSAPNGLMWSLTHGLWSQSAWVLTPAPATYWLCDLGPVA